MIRAISYAYLLFALMSSVTGKALAAAHPASVTDAIEERVIAEQQDNAPVTFSPDNRFFALVTEQGSLGDDDVDGEIDVYNARNLRLIRTFHVASRTDDEPIQNLQWSSDSKTIYFLGTTTGRPQIFRGSVNTGALSTITGERGQIVSFVVSNIGQHIAYVVFPEISSSTDLHQPRYLDQSQTFLSLLQPVAFNYQNPTLVYGSRWQGSWHYTILSDLRYVACADPAFLLGSMSQSGRYIVLLCSPKHPAPGWIDGFSAPIQDDLRRFPNHLKQLVILDTACHCVIPMLNVPWTMIGYDYPSVRWSPRPDLFFVADMFSAINDQSVDTRPTLLSFRVSRPGSPSDIVARGKRLTLFAARSDRTLVVGEPPVNWDFPGKPGFLLTRGRVGWKSGPLPNNTFAVRVIVDQGLNDAPSLVAERKDGSRHPLRLLNPQFASIGFSRVQQITWRGRDGITWVGALYQPLHYRAGSRYPLVIQTHGYVPGVFSQTGLFSTAFAAQALAARDVAVLQVGEPATAADAKRVRRAAASPQEPMIYQAAYEGAIDWMDHRGIVDRTRVGIIGFSRTVWYVEYMLAFSKYKIACAAITDGVDLSYMQYLIMAFDGDEFSKDIGARPFGNQLENYVRRSPAFRVTEIHTPVRVEALGADDLPFMWNIYAALRLAGRPTVMNYIPDASHLLFRPSHRLSSAGGNVDWMLFWLKGEQTHVATSDAEYDVWNVLKKAAR